MQLHPGGPDVPLEVMHAQEQGTLVLFCGAGISVSAGLPTFRGLVNDVRRTLGATYDVPEKTEYRAQNFDRVLGLLERPDRHGAEVRAKVASRLRARADAPLDVHRALLALGTRTSGRVQLVTTNFDDLFERAGDTALMDAPRVPVPKPDVWHGLVYLHGRLPSAGEDYRHLVLTSADFGRAYLVERWAARFVAELFQRFHVLFVGYGLNDPVMRYLLDAVAAERPTDARYHKAFALAPDEPNAYELWCAKGVQPILYSPKDRHVALGTTLTTWASRFNRGLESKASIVADFAEKDPSTLTEEERQHFCWAVADKTGAPARQLTKVGAVAPLKWLPVLEEAQGIGVGLNLVGVRAPTSDLSKAQEGLAAWLLSHVASVDLLAWVMERGAGIRREFRWSLLRQVEGGSPVAPDLEAAWRLLAEHHGPQTDPGDFFTLKRRIEAPSWGPMSRLGIARAWTPYLDFNRPTTLWRTAEGTESDRLVSLLRVSCLIECEHSAEEIVDAVSGRSDWSTVALELLPLADRLIRTALALLEASGQAGAGFDPSTIALPSIVPHQQNVRTEGWLWLVEVIRRCIDVTRQSAVLSHVVAGFASSSLPILRRLVLYAARVADTPAPHETATLLVAAPADWLWNIRLQVELYPLLAELRGRLPIEMAARLQRAIESGPPDAMFRRDVSSDLLARQRDLLIWERLSRFMSSGDPGQSTVLEALSNQHSDWTVSDSDGFLLWSDAGWIADDEASAAMLASADGPDLLEALKGRDQFDNRIRVWSAVVRKDAARGIAALSLLLTDAGAPSAVAATLYEFREATTTDEQRLEVLRQLVAQPSLGRALPATASLARAWAGGRPALDSLVAALATKHFDEALAEGYAPEPDHVTSAIRTSAGNLAEAMLEIVVARKLPRSGGIPPDVKAILSAGMRATAPSGRAARVIIASRLALLHDLDPEWTRAELLPFFNWTNPDEAVGSWQGYMWSPWARPSLWKLLKPDAMETAKRLELLDRWRRSFMQFIAAMSFDGKGLTSLQMRALLKTVEDEDRTIVANWLGMRLSQSNDDQHWRSARKWLPAVWPTEVKFRTKGVATAFARIPLAWPDRFAAGVDLVGLYLIPVDFWYHTAGKLIEQGTAKAEPHAAVRLLGALVPDQLQYGVQRLQEGLALIAAAAPEITNDASFVRLRQIEMENS